MIVAAQVALAVLSLLVLAGGVIGFVRGKSKASLIAGVLFSALLDVSFAVTFMSVKAGLIMGDAIAFALFIVGTWRYRKSGKFMPGGMLQGLAALTLIAVTLAILRV